MYPGGTDVLGYLQLVNNSQGTSSSRLNFGSTDCALPWKWALENRVGYDAVVTITDNETWAGDTHVHQALRAYRKARVPDARSVVIATTSTGFTINDPEDALGLDVVGLDTTVPQVVSNFIRG